MTRVIEIKSCIECPWDSTEYGCNIKSNAINSRIYKIGSIPETCTLNKLEDAGQLKKENKELHGINRKFQTDIQRMNIESMSTINELLTEIKKLRGEK